MALFRRKKADQASVPAELQNYYQAEKRERTGVAWLLAIGTLIITVLIILGLFFGGRWVYRKVHHSKTITTASVQKNGSSKDIPSDSSAVSSGASTGTSSASTSTPSSSASSTTQNSSTSTTTSPAGSTTSTGAASSNLPSTGPSDNLAIFAVVSVLAYVMHRRFATKN